MPLLFSDLDKKIANNTLKLKDITEKALAINIAIRSKLPDEPNFRNPVIQGFIAWLIMYDFLSFKRDLLPTEILNFLIDDGSNKTSLERNLRVAADALEKDFHARIRDDIMTLNEAEIFTRSPLGKIYNYYNKEQITTVLNLLERKSLLKDNILNAIFYLVYRERDGRFFAVSDKEINLASELGLSPPSVVDIKSTHITINEGFNCKNLFECHFKNCATKELPCKIDTPDTLIYCGVTFTDVVLNPSKMYQLELCKNPPVKEVHVLGVEGSITKFKSDYGFPFPKVPVPLHITIGVEAREEALEITQLETKSILDLIDANNPFINPLRKNLVMQNTSCSFFKPESKPITSASSIMELKSTFML